MIEPPLELVGEWLNEAPGEFNITLETATYLINRGALWGASQKLEDLLDD